MPSARRRPVKSASPRRSSPDIRRISTAAVQSARDAREVVFGGGDVLPPHAVRCVECAPHPNPSHSPSVQYFRLWRDSPAGPRHVGDLVLLDSRPRRAAPSPPCTSPPRRRRAPATSGPAPFVAERRVRIHLEQVERQVLGPERDRRVDRLAATASTPLLGQPHHQIEADVVEAGARAPRDSAARARSARMQPRQPPQFLVAERLDAETEPVDAGVRGTPRAVAASTVSGFASSVTSASAATSNAVAAGVDDARDLGGFEQRRRAAAEVDRVGRQHLAGLGLPLGRPASISRDSASTYRAFRSASNRPRLKLQ